MNYISNIPRDFTYPNDYSVLKIENCKWWNSYYNKEGLIIRPREGNIPYLSIETIFEINNEKSLEYNSDDIKISKKVENNYKFVIDDID